MQIKSEPEKTVNNERILLVEDNKEISQMLDKFLSLYGFNCDRAYNGKQGFNKALSDNYDFILLDLTMPEFSGFDLIDFLEKKGKLHTQKIIVLTASSISDEEFGDLIKRGVSKCLRKPIDLDHLLDAILSCAGNITQRIQ